MGKGAHLPYMFGFLWVNGRQIYPFTLLPHHPNMAHDLAGHCAPATFSRALCNGQFTKHGNDVGSLMLEGPPVLDGLCSSPAVNPLRAMPPAELIMVIFVLLGQENWQFSHLL